MSNVLKVSNDYLRGKYEVHNAHLTIYFWPITAAEQIGRFWWKFVKFIFSGKDAPLTKYLDYDETLCRPLAFFVFLKLKKGNFLAKNR